MVSNDFQWFQMARHHHISTGEDVSTTVPNPTRRMRWSPQLLEVIGHPSPARVCAGSRDKRRTGDGAIGRWIFVPPNLYGHIPLMKIMTSSMS